MRSGFELKPCPRDTANGVEPFGVSGVHNRSDPSEYKSKGEGRADPQVSLRVSHHPSRRKEATWQRHPLAVNFAKTHAPRASTHPPIYTRHAPVNRLFPIQIAVVRNIDSPVDFFSMNP